jgi:Flp pilus assembly protein TadD
VRALLALLLLAGCAGVDGFADLRPAAERPLALDVDRAVDPLQTGHALMSAGEHELARRSFARALIDDPQNPVALVGIGSANQALGRFKQAERFLRAAVEADPRSIVGWNNLGVVLHEQGDVVGAEAAFRLAFLLDSGASPDVTRNFNMALASLEQTGETPATDDGDFRLVPLGHGRYFLTTRDPQGDG